MIRILKLGNGPFGKKKATDLIKRLEHVALLQKDSSMTDAVGYCYCMTPIVKLAAKAIAKDPVKAAAYGISETDMEASWRAYAAYCLEQFSEDFTMYNTYPRIGYNCFVNNKGNIQKVRIFWKMNWPVVNSLSTKM